MTSNRRKFLTQAGLGLTAAGLTGMGGSSGAEDGSARGRGGPSLDDLTRQGPKEVVRGKRMVVSAQHPLMSEIALAVLKAGGNAADAATAAAIATSTVQLDMTNHAGTVTCLYHDAKSGKTYELNSAGTLVPNLPLFRPMPFALGGTGEGPVACIPGFMPGIAALHGRFGTKPWKSLVEPSIPIAEDGRPMDEFTRTVLEYEFDFHSYLPSSRELYLPGGFLPHVGETWRNVPLAKTLRRLADEGPEYFTRGGWAQSFVKAANTMGWKIKLDDLSANPPRWGDPLHWQHRGYDIVQLAPPQTQALFCNMVLGILRHCDIVSLGHYTESADSLYYLAHAMRRAAFELSQLADPQFFGVPLDVWMSDDHHARMAKVLRDTRPKAGVDLTRHIELTTGRSSLAAFGYATEGKNPDPPAPAGSSELAIADADGNWVQMMNTLQGGGIPGMVVDGVPMYGSSVTRWLGIPGSRMVQPMGNTIVFKDGKPVLSLGSPGNVVFTVPQVLSNLLDFNKDPYDAVVLPRLSPMRDNGTVEIETRIAPKVLSDLMKLGVRLMPLAPYDFHMGSYQMAFRDAKTGLLGASTDPRRGGRAMGA